MSRLGQRVCHSKYLSHGTIVEVFKRLVLPVLLYGCKAWTLTNDLKRRLDSFGTSNLRRILGYRWFHFMSNDRLLEVTSMKNISELIFERQISMFGHVDRLSSDDPAHRILSYANPAGSERGQGRPLSSWLRQMEGLCRRVGTSAVMLWARWHLPNPFLNQSKNSEHHPKLSLQYLMVVLTLS